MMNSVVAANVSWIILINRLPVTDLTLLGENRLVKVMKLNKAQMNRIATKILQSLEENQAATLKTKPEALQARIVEFLISDIEKEAQLDKDVHKMMDDLESAGQGGFERYKMFPMLKKRLAKEKGIIL